MTLSYTAPLDEMRFTLHDVFDARTFWQNTPALSHMDSDTVDDFDRDGKICHRATAAA